MVPGVDATSPRGGGDEVPAAGTLIGGRYVVEGLLGRGGTSLVLRARDTRLGHIVALKVLRNEEGRRRQDAMRFLREARIIARLKSEHVVTVLDVEAEADPPYLAMELLEGDTVAQLLSAHGRFTPDVALRIVAQACRGVADAHALGVMHRDLKPSNLIVTRAPNGLRRVKVIDFGISKPIVDDPSHVELTSTGQIIGSPRYMSPEQVRGGEEVDGRTDIWALGAILYELIAGVAPFEAPTVADTLARIVRDTPSPLGNYAPDVPPRAASLVSLCLSKDPALRPPDVRALLEELEALAPPAPLSFDDAVAREGTKETAATTQASVERSWSLGPPSLSAPRALPRRPPTPIVVTVVVIGCAGLAWLGAGASGGPEARRAGSEAPRASTTARAPAPAPDEAASAVPEVASTSTPFPSPMERTVAHRELARGRTPTRRDASRADAGGKDEDLELNRRE